jgi:hypothetical protein
MSAVQAPYGLRAVNELGGLPYAGSTRQFPISSASANIYNGSVVAVGTNGLLTLVTTTGAALDLFPAGVVGVFVGCTYVNAQGQVIYAQYFPTGTTGATAYVVDDDRAVFQVQANGQLTQAALGANAIFAAAQTGSTSTGNSTTAISTTVAATATHPFKIVGFVDSTTSSVGDAYTDVLVKFNMGAHAYNTALGVA